MSIYAGKPWFLKALIATRAIHRVDSWLTSDDQNTVMGHVVVGLKVQIFAKDNKGLSTDAHFMRWSSGRWGLCYTRMYNSAGGF